MSISYYSFSEKRLIKQLRKVKLVGYGNPLIYQEADIELLTVNGCDLRPAQRYVLKSKLKELADLWSNGIDFTTLKGYLRLDLPQPLGLLTLTPPIIEEWENNLTIADGMHRCYLANYLNLPINIVKISNIPKEYPYYAYPLDNKWEEVQELDSLPADFMRKFYRDPDNHTKLFRNFNDAFERIQIKR